MVEKVQQLFEIAAAFVAGHVNVLAVESLAELPSTVLSKLVDFLKAEDLNTLDDVLLRNGVDTSSAWRAHLMKRWPHPYQHRTAIFREETRNPRRVYLQKHFHECLRSLSNRDYFDPTTPLLKCLRDQVFFDMKLLKRKALMQNLLRYAEYAEKLILKLAHCHFVLTLPQLLEVLKRSTKVLEVYLGIRISEGSFGWLLNLLRFLRTEGCLQEIHLHLPDQVLDRSQWGLLTRLLRESAAQLHTPHDSLVRVNDSCETSETCDLGPCEISDTCDRGPCENLERCDPGSWDLEFEDEDSCRECYDSDHNLGEKTANTDSIDDDLYNEALVTQGKQERQIAQLNETHHISSARSAMDNRFMVEPFASVEEACKHDLRCCPRSSVEESDQGRQLVGIALYNLNSYGRTAAELAGVLQSWDGLQRLAIHYFGPKDVPSFERIERREASLATDFPWLDGSPPALHHTALGADKEGFLSLCGVLLEKLRKHRLTHLVLAESSTRRSHLIDVADFFSAVLTIINQGYRVEEGTSIRPPIQQLRLPIVCDFQSSSLFGGNAINSPVNAVVHLNVALGVCFTLNRDLQMTAALLSSFIRFDQALRSLTIGDSTSRYFAMNHSQLSLLSQAIAESGRLEELVMDLIVSGVRGIGAVIDMIEQCQSFRKFKLYHLLPDFNDESAVAGYGDQTAELFQEKLAQSIKTHRNLTELVLRGGRNRSQGTFIVGFMEKLFQDGGRMRLRHLDISENVITSDDLLTMLSNLNSSSCAGRSPVLETLTVTVQGCGQGDLRVFSLLKQKLETLSLHVNLRSNDFDGRADYVAQM